MGEHGIELLTMTEEHLPRMLELINLEGWEYELIDLQRILKVDSSHPVVAMVDGGIIGGITIGSHPGRGIFGHVVVDAKWRKRSIGKMMMVEAMMRLEEDGVGILELYAVPDAVNFYIKLGFRRVGELMIFMGTEAREIAAAKTGKELRHLHDLDKEDVFALDRKISGFDRRNILEVLMESNLGKSYGLYDGGRLTGFLLGRFADISSEIGPWIMERPNWDDAALMLNAAIKILGDKIKFIEVPMENPISYKLIEATGLKPQYPVQRLVKTETDVKPMDPGVMCYAALEYG